MKIKVSYFYAVRFMEKTEIPLSTAVFDPKWYVNPTYPGKGWVDRRGVVNGLKIAPLVPGESCRGLCRGRIKCYSPDGTCEFLSAYRTQLEWVDFGEFISWLKVQEEALKKALNISGEITFILLVHEKPDNPCSERVVLKDWFSKNGLELDEYDWRKSF